MERSSSKPKVLLRDRSGAHGSWFLASETSPVKVDGQFTSVGGSEFLDEG